MVLYGFIMSFNKNKFTIVSSMLIGLGTGAACSIYIYLGGNIHIYNMGF